MDNLTKLLQNSSEEEILEILQERLDKSDEPDFWKEKIIPYVQAILSVLIPLQKQDLLFNPEGKIVESLNSELFYRWADLVCLRTLAFIIEQSNENNQLIRTEYKNVNYKSIDLEKLGTYLSSNRINLIDEDNLDFPMSTYNTHIAMITIVKDLLS